MYEVEHGIYVICNGYEEATEYMSILRSKDITYGIAKDRENIREHLEQSYEKDKEHGFTCVKNNVRIEINWNPFWAIKRDGKKYIYFSELKDKEGEVW